MKLLTFLVSVFIFLTWFYFHYFVYIDPLNFCIITTPPAFNYNTLKIKQAISAIKYNSPTDYKNLCQRISHIDTGEYCPAEPNIAGCFSETKPRTINVKTLLKNELFSPGQNFTPAVVSSVIIHELCHAMQHKEGRLKTGYDPEPECSAKDRGYANSNFLP